MVTQYTEQIETTATEIAWNIYLSYDVAMLQRFVQGLHFINDKLNEYAEEYFHTSIWPQCPLHHYFRNKKYYPLLLEMQQHDCDGLLADIIGFARAGRPVFATCKNVVKLNKYLHLAHTFDFYLKSVKRHNPAFWHRLPQHVQKSPHLVED